MTSASPDPTRPLFSQTIHRNVIRTQSSRVTTGRAFWSRRFLTVCGTVVQVRMRRSVPHHATWRVGICAGGRMMMTMIWSGRYRKPLVPILITLRGDATGHFLHLKSMPQRCYWEDSGVDDSAISLLLHWCSGSTANICQILIPPSIKYYCMCGLLVWKRTLFNGKRKRIYNKILM